MNSGLIIVIWFGFNPAVSVRIKCTLFPCEQINWSHERDVGRCKLKSVFPDVGEIKEYCSFEYFHPRCTKNEVVVITSAIYGRMTEGRCLEINPGTSIKQDPQYFGCSDDVLEFMDVKCSGRTECSVGVYDQQLKQRSSCYKDLEKYLEASYACISGKYSNSLNLG